MKKTLLLFSLLLFQYTIAQNILFSDVNFKNALLLSKIDHNNPNATNYIDYPFIDSNNDGEISQQEALLVIRLDMGYAQINDLSGLEYFTNLKSFNSLFFDSSSFNFPMLINLENLTLSNAVSGQSNLTSLDLSSNVNLKNLTCRVNGNINLNNLTNLKSLYLNGTFTEIDLSDSTNLLELYLTAPINQLNLSSNTKLINLQISGCSIQNLDVSFCPNLETITANQNQMETVNFGSIKHVRYLYLQDNLLTSLNVNNFFNLYIFNCNNNLLNELFIKNTVIQMNGEIEFSGNPTLETICCDENEVVYIQNLCNLYDYSTNVGSCQTVGSKAVTMFPNPVKDMLHLDSAEKINKIELFGSNGLLIMASEKVSDVVDMQTLQSGLYFLKVYRDNDISEMKFMKG